MSSGKSKSLGHLQERIIRLLLDQDRYICRDLVLEIGSLRSVTHRTLISLMERKIIDRERQTHSGSPIQGPAPFEYFICDFDQVYELLEIQCPQDSPDVKRD